MASVTGASNAHLAEQRERMKFSHSRSAGASNAHFFIEAGEKLVLLHCTVESLLSYVIFAFKFARM